MHIVNLKYDSCGARCKCIGNVFAYLGIYLLFVDMYNQIAKRSGVSRFGRLCT